LVGRWLWCVHISSPRADTPGHLPKVHQAVGVDLLERFERSGYRWEQLGTKMSH
jgi:hypothetical protein